MASRTKQKEEARERRLAEEQARAERARRERRLRMIGGVIVLAVAILAVAIAVSSGGSSGGGLKKGKQQTQTVASVTSLLSGIPQSGATLGNPNAPVTMVYYGDLQCPICRDFTVSGGLTPLIRNEVKQGKVKIVYKSFETATRDPSVFKTQQVAALAAGKQNRFWDYAELFYRQQGAEGTSYVTDAYLQNLAKQVPGLNPTQWESDRNNSTLANQVASDVQSGTSVGVQGTPTLVFTGPKGQTAIGNTATYPQLQQAVQKVS